MGDDLPVFTVYGASGKDRRRRCFATTSVDEALMFACQRGLGTASRDTLYVYRVDLTEPRVDTNWHAAEWHYAGPPVTCVMAPRGVNVEIVQESPVADCTKADLFRRDCEACKAAGLSE